MTRSIHFGFTYTSNRTSTLEDINNRVSKEDTTRVLRYNIVPSVTINTSCIQHRLELRVMMKQLAVPKLSQSTPHVVGTVSLLFPHVVMTHGLMYCEHELLVYIA